MTFAAIVSITLSLALICALPALPEEKANTNNSRRWCVINAFDRFPDGVVELPRFRLHVVRKELQKKAMRQLRSSTFVPLTHSAALIYMRDGEAFSPDSYIYLVRMAAFGIDSEFNVNSAAFGQPSMHAFYAKTSDSLRLFEYSLSPAGAIPMNFAMMVETDGPVVTYRADCLTFE